MSTANAADEQVTVEITTVSDDHIEVHRIATTDAGDTESIPIVSVVRSTDLEPATSYAIDARSGTVLGPWNEQPNAVHARTLPRPDGDLLARITTVNDVHFGEVEAGRIDDHTDGPIRRAAPGAPPYPEVMNVGAASEMAAVHPDAVIVKGDLSVDGRPEEWAAFEACYRAAFGEQLHVVRGNHDAYQHQGDYAGDQQIDVDGLTVALLDTVIPGATTGTLHPDQIEWLHEVAASADRPVIAMGHHQQWIGGADGRRSDDYFGMHPDPSDRLDDVAAAHTSLIGYAAGHTHRHRVRRMRLSGVASIEIGCTKDFPGTWAEYRVFEGGVLQVVHRVSRPEALAWSEPCRALYADFGIDYGTYALGTLGERCFAFDARD